MEKKTWGISFLAIGAIAFGIITLLAVNHRIDCHVLAALGNYGGGGCIGVGVLSTVLAISREYRHQKSDSAMSKTKELVWLADQTTQGDEILEKYQSKIDALVQEIANSQKGQEIFDQQFLIRTEEGYVLFLTVDSNQARLEISQDDQWDFDDNILIATGKNDEYLQFRDIDIFKQIIPLFKKNMSQQKSPQSRRFEAFQIEEQIVLLKQERHSELMTLWLYKKEDKSYLQCWDALSLIDKINQNSVC